MDQFVSSNFQVPFGLKFDPKPPKSCAEQLGLDLGPDRKSKEAVELEGKGEGPEGEERIRDPNTQHHLPQLP